MMTSETRLASPDDMVRAAERLYDEKFREKCEEEHQGKYVVIDLVSGEIFIDEAAEIALQKARESSLGGVFHLLRIGQPGAARAGFIGNAQCQPSY